MNTPAIITIKIPAVIGSLTPEPEPLEREPLEREREREPPLWLWWLPTSSGRL